LSRSERREKIVVKVVQTLTQGRILRSQTEGKARDGPCIRRRRAFSFSPRPCGCCAWQGVRGGGCVGSGAGCRDEIDAAPVQQAKSVREGAMTGRGEGKEHDLEAASREGRERWSMRGGACAHAPGEARERHLIQTFGSTVRGLCTRRGKLGSKLSPPSCVDRVRRARDMRSPPDRWFACGTARGLRGVRGRVRSRAKRGKVMHVVSPVESSFRAFGYLNSHHPIKFSANPYTKQVSYMHHGFNLSKSVGNRKKIVWSNVFASTACRSLY